MNMKIISLMLLVILFQFSSSYDLWAQNNPENRPVFGVRYGTGFTTQVKKNQNYKVIHFMPVFTIDLNNNCFYLGPEYAYFIPPEPAGSILYNSNGWGVNFGYRLYSNEFSGKLRVFGQFNSSIYQVRSTFFGHMGMNSFDKNLIFTEYNLALGFNFRLGRSLHLFSGFGTSLIGSKGDNSGYLDMEPFVPTVFLGIDYKLGLSEEK